MILSLRRALIRRLTGGERPVGGHGGAIPEKERSLDVE